MEEKFTLQDLHLKIKHLYLAGIIKDNIYRDLSDTLDGLYEKESLVFSLRSYLQTAYIVICSYDLYDTSNQDKRRVSKYLISVNKFIKVISDVQEELESGE